MEITITLEQLSLYQSTDITACAVHLLEFLQEILKTGAVSAEASAVCGEIDLD